MKARSGRKEKKYILTPIFLEENKKIDYHGLLRALKDERGKGTTACKNFGIDTFNSNFDEKDGYSLNVEIWVEYTCRPCFVVGQKGLFLKVEETAAFASVNDFLARHSSFVEFVKAYTFNPIGIAHYLDGDYYLIDNDDVWSSKRAGVPYELFESDEER